MLQTEIGINLLQSSVFILKILELSDVGGIHPSVFSLSVLVGGIRDAIIPAELLDLTASLCLFQDPYDLCLCIA